MVNKPDFREFSVTTPQRIAALWASTMFCYVYGDLIGFYIPGRIAATAAGDFGPLGKVTPFLLTATAAVMAVPALMIALSLMLPARITRLANMAVALVYTFMIAASCVIAPPYYILLGVIEMSCTLTIVWLGLRWPREKT